MIGPGVPQTGLLALAFMCLGTAVQDSTPQMDQSRVTISKVETKGFRVDIDGRLFTQSHHGPDLQKPFFHPVIAPNGVAVTRAWPIEDGSEGEAHDHPHHVSLWFAHGDVNGHDFWHGPNGERIVHIESSRPREATVESSFEWRDAEGNAIVREDRAVTFASHDSAMRIMEFTLTLTAMQPQVTFGDTKEGTFAMRLAPTLRLQGDVAAGSARNSEGVEGSNVWGKRAKWIAYSGPVEEENVTVAIFDHPANPRHPTWWHARDYGLVAANPFGVHDFEGKPEGTGDLHLAEGESITLRYCIVVAAAIMDNQTIHDMWSTWARAADPANR